MRKRGKVGRERPASSTGKGELSSADKSAVELFDILTKNPQFGFPRPPEAWAKPLPKSPVRGLLMSDDEYSEALRAHREKVETKKQSFVPEEVFVSLYLSGTVVEDDKGRHHQEYPGATVEQLGRSILTNLLKSDAPIPRDIRNTLAVLFDPNRNELQWSEREFVIKFREKGKRRAVIRDIQFCEDVASGLNSGLLVKQAIGCAMDKHGLKRSAALRIWTSYRDTFVSLGWLKDATRTKSKIKPE